MVVRTRFAPSPTGYLHIGGARTALFNWAYARHHQGEFYLRVEDTDQERSTAESTQAILDGMGWLELHHDGEVVYQSSRWDRYKHIAEELLNQCLAYRCQCSVERLAALREAQIAQGEKPRYDGHCRDLQLGDDIQKCVIRFRNPQEGHVHFHDEVHGDITIANAELDDIILVRSDGIPTYNFCVVIDDMDMKITHVIRGDDHINNTPRQINILHALKGNVPVYAHVPMILGPDGKRLSKRHGAVSVMQYREEGYLPQALLNYLIRLGWSHGDEEILTPAHICELFDFKGLNKSAASINPDKLLWLNQHYQKTQPAEKVAEELAYQFSKIGINNITQPPLTEIVKAQAERCKTLVEMAEKSRYFYVDNIHYDETELQKHVKPEILPALTLFLEKLTELSIWNKETIHQQLEAVVTSTGIKFGKIAQPIRIAVTGSTISPSLDITLALIGREKTLQRINALLTHCINS
ncbi:MAG: glutamate--tRNA ligase [Legionellales bacterium]|nr:glutamate--tRNA ligase [Legionellales bacterium]